jgi:hypothetical protein
MRCEDYPVYREVYKNLPNMKFSGNSKSGVILSDYPGFLYDIQEEFFYLNEDSCLFRDNLVIFDLYSWYWHRKYVKWFKDTRMLMLYNL